MLSPATRVIGFGFRLSRVDPVGKAEKGANIAFYLQMHELYRVPQFAASICIVSVKWN